MRGLLSITAVALLATACYAEGNSEFLTSGETRYFLTMGACEEEATSTYQEAGSVYSGFECRKKLAWFLVETRRYYNGKQTQ